MIVTELAKGRTKIIFDDACEALRPHAILKFHNFIRQIPGLDYSDVFHATGQHNGQRAYDAFAARFNLRPGVRIIHTNAQITQYHVSTLINQKTGQLNPVKPYDVRLKEKKFVCLNKLQKGHRAYLLARMLENGLFDESFYSFEGEGQWLDGIDYNYAWAPVIAEQFKKHLDKFPIRLNITDDRTNPVMHDSSDDYYHDESYFSLVTETLFYDQHFKEDRFAMYPALPGGTFFTEKIARPLSTKHPFVLASTHLSLQTLKDMGFRTFHPFIDESYDSVLDPDLRLDMIVNEVARLCKQTDAEWIVWQYNVKEIVEHNYQQLIKFSGYSTQPNLIDMFTN